MQVVTLPALHIDPMGSNYLHNVKTTFLISISILNAGVFKKMQICV